jgi:hypothetical protein
MMSPLAMSGVKPPSRGGINSSTYPGSEAGISDATRQHLDEVMQRQAARARELIEMEAMDPAHPSPIEVMRAMQYANEEAMAELRAKLSPEELQTLFPGVANGFAAPLGW